MKDTPIKLSVVIPMFNEAENIRHTVDAVAATLRDGFTDGPWEIVVVNDGSLDDTWERARTLAGTPGYEFLRVAGYGRNRGRGYALRTGFETARGVWISSIDADLTYEPATILRMVAELRENEDIDMVLASVYMPGGEAVDLPFDRYAASKLGNTLLSWFMSPGGKKVYTITCVVRAYRREVLDNMELESDGKDIHLEILSKAIMLGYRFKEIPATLHTRKRGQSKFKFKHTAASHLIFALFERPIIIFGMLGVIALLLAIAIFIFLMAKYFSGINIDRPLLSMMIILFLGGFQLISFGILGTQFVNLRKEIIKIQGRLRRLSRENKKP